MSADCADSLLPLRCSSRYLAAVYLHENAPHWWRNSEMHWHWEDFTRIIGRGPTEIMRSQEPCKGGFGETKSATKMPQIFDGGRSFFGSITCSRPRISAARRPHITVGYISKKGHNPNFENQECAPHTIMIHHNLTKAAMRGTPMGGTP